MRNKIRNISLLSIAIILVIFILFVIIKVRRKVLRPAIVNGILFNADISRNSSIAALGLIPSGNNSCRITKAGGRHCIEVPLNRNRDAVSYRTELVPYNLPEQYFTKRYCAKIGQTYWYKIQVYLPQNWPISNIPKTIMQWHGQPDFNLGENWRNPPLDLEIDSGSAGAGMNYFIWHRADSKRVTGSEGPYELSQHIQIGNIENDLGKWTNWLFHIKWSYKNDGFIVIYKNGREIFRRENEKNCYNDKNGPIWKFGVYIPTWKDPNVSTYGMNSYTDFFDSIMIGNENAKFRLK